MLATSGMKLFKSQNAEYSLQKYGDHYQFVIKVNAFGSYYRIYKSSYMKDSYEVIIGSAVVDSTKSYCHSMDIIGLTLLNLIQNLHTVVIYKIDSVTKSVSQNSYQNLNMNFLLKKLSRLRLIVIIIIFSLKVIMM